MHSDIGNTFIGAKVNGKRVTISTKLNTGDICEILTRKSMKPSTQWLECATTVQARSKIRKYLRENK